MENSINMYIIGYNMDGCEKLLCSTGRPVWFPDDLEGQDAGRGGKLEREGTYVIMTGLHYRMTGTKHTIAKNFKLN